MLPHVLWASAASVATVASVACTEATVVVAVSSTSSSFNGRCLGGRESHVAKTENSKWSNLNGQHPPPRLLSNKDDALYIFFGFSLIEITISVCCLFLFSIPRLAGNCFYQSVFGSASASTSIGASAVLWLGTFETAAEEPLSGGDVCFGTSVVEFGGYRLSMNMYMIIWMYVCRYVGMSVYNHIQYDL